MSKLKRRMIIALIGAIVLVFSGWLYLQLRVNLHVVIPGQVYRSAQLSTDTLKSVILEYHLRAILNLRGDNPHQPWYQHELALSHAQHLVHKDIALRAYQMPSPTKLRRLVALLQTMPRPFLLHCKGGADRAGLASAIVKLLSGDSYQDAYAQISVRYLAISRMSVGRLVLPLYKSWLDQQGWRSTRQRFLTWVSTTSLHELASPGQVSAESASLALASPALATVSSFQVSRQLARVPAEREPHPGNQPRELRKSQQIL